MGLPRIVIGPPVRGHDLWDRNNEVAQIWKTLNTGSVLLPAPRRFGKTSIMLSLVDRPKEGWHAHFLDVEWVSGPGDFVAEITTTLIARYGSKELLRKVGKIAGRALDRIKEVEVIKVKLALRESLQDEWQDKGKALIKLLTGIEQKIILIVDELPLLVLNIAKKESPEHAEEFLFWLRGLRNIPELQDKVHWIFGGSIGMEKVLQRVGAGTKAINDLYMLPIREFSDEEARKFVRALLQKELGTNGAIPQLVDRFLRVIGIPIPYFLQILVRESLNEMEREGAKELSGEIIEKAYQDGVLASYNRTYFEHYYERIRDYYDQELANAANALLSQMARAGSLAREELWNLYKQETQGKGREDDFSYLLSDLENDFYITNDTAGGRYRFATKVLQDWWLRHHVG